MCSKFAYKCQSCTIKQRVSSNEDASVGAENSFPSLSTDYEPARHKKKETESLGTQLESVRGSGGSTNLTEKLLKLSDIVKTLRSDEV
jgi:hypothetical protein